jgi:vitamin B12 transporter
LQRAVALAPRPSFGGFYANLDRREARGLELSRRARPGGRAHAQGSPTPTSKRRTRERTTRTAGGTFPAARKHAAYLDADYRFAGGLSLGGGVQHVGERFDDAANTVPLESYTLVDLRAAYRLRDGVELFGRVENALDQHYEDVRLYGTPGRGAFAGVRARF